MNNQVNSVQMIVWVLNFDFHLVAYITQLYIGRVLAKNPLETKTFFIFIIILTPIKQEQSFKFRLLKLWD